MAVESAVGITDDDRRRLALDWGLALFAGGASSGGMMCLERHAAGCAGPNPTRQGSGARCTVHQPARGRSKTARPIAPA